MPTANWWDLDLKAREARRAGDYEQAERLFLESLRLAAPHAELDYHVNILYNTIADFYREWGKLDVAVTFARDGLALDRQNLRPNDRSLLHNDLIFLAKLLDQVGAYEEAIRLVEEALPLSEKIFGQGHYLLAHDRMLLESLQRKGKKG